MKYNPKIVLAYFRECGIPEPETEVQFAESLGRKFRFDFAWEEVWKDEHTATWPMVALEVEGGIYTRGAHGSISGIKRDMEKYNLAASLGWRVLRVTPENLCTNETISLIQTTLGNFDYDKFK